MGRTRTLALLGLLLCNLGCERARQLLVSNFSPSYAPPPAEKPAETPPYRWTEVLSGLAQPTDVQFVPGQPQRVVVLQKEGAARVFDLSPQGARELAPLLAVEVMTEVELGLLGLAFHPKFAENGRFFIHWTPKAGKMRSRISEWHISASGVGNVAAVEKREILEVTQPYQNHNGGQLQFGPDGMLYIGLGDGGWRNDPHHAGQNNATLLGKMLRVDVDTPERGLGYGIPQDNPYALGSKTVLPEIWARGLRNPWRFSFAPDGRLIVADVGQDKWEEVDIVTRGANLGWNVREGLHCFEPAEACPSEGLTDPIFEYGRDLGNSITGGYVVLGDRAPSLRGQYVFGDFVSGRVWALKLPEPGVPAQGRLLGQWPMLVSTFGRDAAGNLYAADFGKGTLSVLDGP
jgi:glucose/arabinose dehydrogenase